MKIENIPTDQLIPYARNSRTHSDTQISQIVASIQEFGFTNPVLIDENNEIIAGHGRVMAAVRMDRGSIPCVRITHLTQQQKRAYVIADNQIALNSGWNETLLAEELNEIDLPNFDMDDLFTAELTNQSSHEIIEDVNTGHEEIIIPAEAFLTDEEKQQTEATHDFVKITRYQRPKTVKYENAKNLAQKIGILNTGEHVNAIVSGDFIAGDFLEAYLVENDLIADEIIISTLSMSSQNVDSLQTVQEYLLSETGRIGLIISDYFFAHERKDGIEDIVKHLGNGQFTLAVAGIHTKITLIRTTCGMNLIIGGSANLRSSMNIEQITLDNCPIQYAFHRKWMAEILNNYQASHKLLRRKELWQLVQKAEER
jgi:hypothetical protein